jgi:hypothetical protein
MLASGSTSSRISLAASSTSNSVMSRPPVMLISTPLAPFIDTSSSSGLDGGFGRLHGAVLAGRLRPVPIIALPISRITERTSAKSRLIRPGMTIRSVMPRNARIQHLVGHAEGFGEGRLVVGDAEQVLVRNDDQRIDMLCSLDAGIRQCMRRCLRNGTAW